MSEIKKLIRQVKNIPSLLSKGFVVNSYVIDQMQIHPPDCVVDQAIVVELPNNKRLAFHAGQYVPLLYTVNEVVQQECYTKHLQGGIASLGRGSVILDIGANVGIFSIYASALSECKVYAVEMDSITYGLLIENVRANSDSCDVTCINSAISATTGTIRYIHSSDTVGTTIAEVNSEIASSSLSKAMTLPDFINLYGIEQVSLLKMDCEGSEYDIVTSLSDDTMSKIERISLEYHLRASNSSHQLNEMIKKLRRHYKMVDIVSDPIRSNIGMVYAW